MTSYTKGKMHLFWNCFFSFRELVIWVHTGINFYGKKSTEEYSPVITSIVYPPTLPPSYLFFIHYFQYLQQFHLQKNKFFDIFWLHLEWTKTLKSGVENFQKILLAKDFFCIKKQNTTRSAVPLDFSEHSNKFGISAGRFRLLCKYSLKITNYCNYVHVTFGEN